MNIKALLKAPRMWLVPSASGETGPIPGTVHECTEFAEGLAKRVKDRVMHTEQSAVCKHLVITDELITDDYYSRNGITYPYCPKCGEKL